MRVSPNPLLQVRTSFQLLLSRDLIVILEDKACTALLQALLYAVNRTSTVVLNLVCGNKLSVTSFGACQKKVQQAQQVKYFAVCQHQLSLHSHTCGEKTDADPEMGQLSDQP